MKRLIVLFFVSFIFGSIAQDAVFKCEFLRDGNSYILLTENGFLQRRQTQTGKLLVDYKSNFKAEYFEIDEPNNELLSITKNSVNIFALNSGDSIRSLQLPASTNAYDFDYKYRQPTDFYKSKLYFVSNNELFVIDSRLGKVIASNKFAFDIAQFFVLDNEDVLVLGEYNGQLQQFNYKAAETTLICETNRRDRLAVNPERSRFSIGSEGQLIWYIVQKGKVLRDKQSKYTNDHGGHVKYVNSTVHLDQPNGVFEKYWGGLRFFFNDSNDYNDFPLNGTCDGFDAVGNKVVYWDKNKVSVIDLNGFDISVTDIKETNEKGISKDLQSLYCDSMYTAHDRYKGNLILGASTGDLLFNKKYKLLSTAVTAINVIDEDRVLAGGIGRVVLYNMKTSVFEKVFRGLDGAPFFIDKKGDLLFISTKYTAYVFLEDGRLIKNRTYTQPIKSIHPSADLLGVSFLTGSDEIQFENEREDLLHPKQKLLMTYHHQTTGTTVEFSEDGRRILSCDIDGNIKIWDSRNLVSIVETFIDDVSNVKFVGKENEVLAYNQSRLFLLDAYTLAIKREYSIPAKYKYKTRFNIVREVFENIVVFSSIQANELWMLNLNTGQIYLGGVNTGYIFGMVCDSIDQILYTHGKGGISKIDLKSFKVVGKIPNPNELNDNAYVEQEMSLSPDRSKLIVEGKASISIISTLTNEVVRFFEKSYFGQFITDDEYIVYHNINKWDGVFSLCLYKLSDPEFKNEFWRSKELYAEKAIRPSIRNVRINKPLNLMLLNYITGQMEILDLKSLKSIRYSESTIARQRVKFNPKNNTIAVARSNRLVEYDWRTMKKVKSVKFNYQKELIKANFQYSNSGKYLLRKYGTVLEVCSNRGDTIFSKYEVISDENTFSQNEMMLMSKDMDKIQVQNTLSGELILDFALKGVEKEENWLGDFHFLDESTIVGFNNKRRNGVDMNDFAADKFIESVVYISLNTGKVIRRKEIDVTSAIYSVKSSNYLFFESGYNEISRFNLETYKLDIVKGFNNVDKLFFNPFDDKLIITTEDGMLFQYDFEKEKKDTFSLNIGMVRDMDFNKDRLLICSKNGHCVLMDNTTKNVIIDFGFISNEGFLFYTDELYYSGENINSVVHYSKGDQIFPFTQFDLKYNRPDLVLESIGEVSKDVIKTYNDAYKKRLQKMNFTENMLKADFHLPEIAVTNKASLPILLDTDKLTLDIQASDPKYPLDRINIWINNVPIYGVNGISLRSKMIKSYENTIELQLNEGNNKIEVSVLNQAGAESYKETIYINCTKPAPKPNLYFVGIGVRDYENSDMNLKYSDKDIRDMVKMYEKNTAFGKVYIDTFLNASATKEILPEIKKRMTTTTIHDQVVFMYSGHGILDDSLDYFLTTHDIDFLNPKGKGIPYEAVDELLDHIPARQKLVLIDACNSGEVDKDEMIVNNFSVNNNGVSGEIVGPKGDLFKQYTTKTNSFEMMQELFTDLRRGTGATVISSSSGKYFSFEDKQYQNGVYTYALKLGLEGNADENKDEVITVTELKEYLYKKVEALTNGKQKPTARQENLEYDFRVW
jgi:WD40 repeat protein